MFLFSLWVIIRKIPMEIKNGSKPLSQTMSKEGHVSNAGYVTRLCKPERLFDEMLKVIKGIYIQNG